MGRLRGKIFYQSGERPRIVSRVEWFDDQQRVRFVDYYSKNGIKFAQTVYDLNRKAILKKYMTAEGKEVIYENFVTSDVILIGKGSLTFSLQSSHSYYFLSSNLKLRNIIRY